MTHRHASAAVGDRAVISGVAAALLLHEALPSNPRRELAARGLSGERLQIALEAVEALREAASAWREEVASADGNGERQDGEGLVASAPMTTDETAQLLGISPRRVRQLASEGELRATHLGSALVFETEDVLALHRSRQGGDSSS